jgi:hypothetical protein
VTPSNLSPRLCPKCQAPVPGDTDRCECGQTCALAAREDEPPSGDLLVQAESLYESYLSARLHRALKSLKALKVDMLRDPANKQLTAQVRQGEREIQILEDQLAAQIARTAEAKKKAEEARIRPQPPAPETPAATAGVHSTAEPPAAFHSEQSAKAETVVQTAPQVHLLEAYRSGETAAIFRAAQTVRAGQAVGTAAGETKNCPNCFAILPAGEHRCLCGYLFTSGPPPEAAFLTEEELLALRKTS